MDGKMKCPQGLTKEEIMTTQDLFTDECMHCSYCVYDNGVIICTAYDLLED